MRIIKLLLIFTVILVSCQKIESKEKSTIFLKSEKEYSPLSFIHELKNKKLNNVSTIVREFPENWIKRQHIDSLFSLIESKEKCNCYLNPLSSYIPTDSAEVGGFAIEFVKTFKEKRKVDLGLYYCPKVNQNEAEALKSWWKKYRQLK